MNINANTTDPRNIIPFELDFVVIVVGAEVDSLIKTFIPLPSFASSSSGGKLIDTSNIAFKPLHKLLEQ